MIFSSILFLVYFLPIFLGVYYLADKSYKNGVILVGSIIFYAWGAPKFIYAILATTTLDFFLVQKMWHAQNETLRKVFLLISLTLNIGLLFFFKYSNFFVDNINLVLHSVGIQEIKWLKLALPIGISFYTFETLTYVIDVYRRVHKPLNHFWNYQTYILLFPKLIAGPIIRYHEISEQLTNRQMNGTEDGRLGGFYRFVIGLSKKVLIANIMGAQADAIYGLNVAEISSTTAWIASFAYTFQIYFDFSGYSDMAIGLGKMMGFTFPENFNNPYTATSITDFWRRWHITLGSWMRNYLYIPLGGNQVKHKWRLYFNLWIVFLLSGFWHGAAWSFIVWGAYHGLFLVWERLYGLRILAKIGRIPAILLTFFIVNIGWVFFRLEDLSKGITFVKKMFAFDFSIENTALMQLFPIISCFALFFSFFTLPQMGQRIQNYIYEAKLSVKEHIAFSLLFVLLFFLSLSYVATSNFNPFIYFRF